MVNHTWPTLFCKSCKRKKNKERKKNLTEDLVCKIQTKTFYVRKSNILILPAEGSHKYHSEGRLSFSQKNCCTTVRGRLMRLLIGKYLKIM